MNGGIFSFAIRVPEIDAAERAGRDRGEDARSTSAAASRSGTRRPSPRRRSSACRPTDRCRAVMMTKVLAIAQHAVDRRRLQDAEDVVHLREGGRGEAEEDEEQDQAREREQLLPRLVPEEAVGLTPPAGAWTSAAACSLCAAMP